MLNILARHRHDTINTHHTNASSVFVLLLVCLLVCYLKRKRHDGAVLLARNPNLTFCVMLLQSLMHSYNDQAARA